MLGIHVESRAVSQRRRDPVDADTPGQTSVQKDADVPVVRMTVKPVSPLAALALPDEIQRPVALVSHPKHFLGLVVI